MPAREEPDEIVLLMLRQQLDPERFAALSPDMTKARIFETLRQLALRRSRQVPLVILVEDLVSTGGSSLQAVRTLREAGAVIIGKTALEEYATSGYYSNDEWGQVWNPFSPSRSAIASMSI